MLLYQNAVDAGDYLRYLIVRFPLDLITSVSREDRVDMMVAGTYICHILGAHFLFGGWRGHVPDRNHDRPDAFAWQRTILQLIRFFPSSFVPLSHAKTKED